MVRLMRTIDSVVNKQSNIGPKADVCFFKATHTRTHAKS